MFVYLFDILIDFVTCKAFNFALNLTLCVTKNFSFVVLIRKY